MLQETEKPLVTHRVEKASVIGVEYPVHLPSLDANDQRVQGIMLTAPRSESIREPEEVFLVDRIKHGRREISLRSEEHTSELQSLAYLVCRLLLEKKKK